MISKIKYKYQSKRGILTQDQQKLHLRVHAADTMEADEDTSSPDQVIKAIHLYKTNLQVKCFKSMKIYIQSANRNDIHIIQADSFNKLKLKQKCFEKLAKYRSR